MPNQKWFCDTCRKRGEVEFEEDADVMSVGYLLQDAHKAASRKCPIPVGKIHAVNEACMTPGDWEAFYALTPATPSA